MLHFINIIMILNENIKYKVGRISTNRLRKFGYDVHPGDIIVIPIKHLPKGAAIKVKCKCDNCNKIYNEEYRYLQQRKRAIKFCPKHRKENAYIFLSKRMKNEDPIKKQNRVRAMKLYWETNKKDRRDFLEYRWIVLQVTQTWKNEINLLLNAKKIAYTLDHKYSIWEGFKNSISPNIIGHIKNLEWLPKKQNRLKGKTSSISLNKLNEMIENDKC